MARGFNAVAGGTSRVQFQGPSTPDPPFTIAVDVISAAPASAGIVQESYLRLGQSLADLKAGEAFRIRLSRASTQGADSMTDDSELIRAELAENT